MAYRNRDGEIIMNNYTGDYASIRDHAWYQQMEEQRERALWLKKLREQEELDNDPYAIII